MNRNENESIERVLKSCLEKKNEKWEIKKGALNDSALYSTFYIVVFLIFENGDG